MVRRKATLRHAEVQPLKCVVYITQNPVTFIIHRRRELYLLDQQAREGKTKQRTSGMSTRHPRDLQLPL